MSPSLTSFIRRPFSKLRNQKEDTTTGNTNNTTRPHSMRGSTELDITQVGPKAFSVLMGSPSKHWRSHKGELIDRAKNQKENVPPNVSGNRLSHRMSMRMESRKSKNNSMKRRTMKRKSMKKRCSIVHDFNPDINNLQKQIWSTGNTDSHLNTFGDLNSNTFFSQDEHHSSPLAQVNAEESKRDMFTQLKECLECKEQRWWFKQYCKQERSAENVHFWEEVYLRFKTLPYSHQIEAAVKIYRQYIEPESPYALNINGALINAVGHNIFSDNPTVPLGCVFDEVLEAVEKGMLDTFSRYITNDMSVVPARRQLPFSI
eukprot:gb/GECH01008197.1/.p1 GENE.gb/GECH01008197.1/~~gb/GECH01008197.1/.p1  ORF type:complete len:316 (+),score=56.52 gb/GECH01008197.1/:1-948(+)